MSVTMFEEHPPFTNAPGAAEFVKLYHERAAKAGIPDPTVEVQAAASYTAWQILEAGVRGAGSLDDKAIAAWLKTHHVQTITRASCVSTDRNNYGDDLMRSSRSRTVTGSPCIRRSSPHRGATLHVHLRRRDDAAEPTLLAQSALSGVFIGSLYGLLGLGLGLVLGPAPRRSTSRISRSRSSRAYLCYQLASVGGMDPLLTLALIVPLFFALGVGPAVAARRASRFRRSIRCSRPSASRRSSRPGSSGMWTADFRKLESAYAGRTFKVGALFVPLPELLTLVLSLALAFGIWAALRYTDLGRALRALAEDAPIAAAFGVNRRAHALVLAGVCGALAGIAGVCLALTLHADAVADLRVGRRRLRRRDAGRTRLARSARSPAAS